MKTKTKILTTDNIFKALAFLLFCSYLAQLYVSYAIDYERVFENDLVTVLIFALRWTTIVSVGFNIIYPFYKGKMFKIWSSILGPITGILNLIFFKANMTAWGTVIHGVTYAYVPWRSYVFIAEQVLMLIISIRQLVLNIKEKAFKEIKVVPFILTLVGMYLTFTYESMFTILFGEYGDKTLDFNTIHLIFLSMNVILILGGYIVMKDRTIEERNTFFAALACSGVFNYFYVSYGGVTSLPLHLCNTAIIMMFMAFIFKMKGIFYFTYFVNVLGAAFAMIFPNVTTDAYTLSSIRFWYNHIYAFSIPLLGICLKVYPRPTLKMMGKAIAWFSLYFVLVMFINRYLSALGYNPDYFFINSEFLFDKLKFSDSQRGLMRNYFVYMNFFGVQIKLFWLFYIAVYSTYIGLMFLMWFIYDAGFHIADSHRALRAKKKLIKLGYKDLKKELNGRSLKDPLRMESKDMLEIKNFTKVYNGSNYKSVDDFSLTVHNGEVFGFIGHNGAGKSTTIKSIVGIQSITSGSISVEGYDVSKQPVEAKLRIGYVSDNHAVYEKLTGREYINYIADLYMVSKEDRDARIEKYVKMFCLTDAIDREIKSYSHGMKQKIVVIASLIHDPKVWILDEPLTGLDPTSSYQIKECMRDHANRGNIVFFSSHVIEVVERICDRIAIINHGKKMCEYTLKELKEKGITLEELFLKYVNTKEE